MQDQLLHFQLDTDTQRHLKQAAQNLRLSESDFIRKAIWEFETLLPGNPCSLPSQEFVTPSEITLRQLRTQLEAYEQEPSLKALFAAHKGQTIDGRLISHPLDLVGVLAQTPRITAMEPASEAQPIVLHAQPSRPSGSLAEPDPDRRRLYDLLLLALLGIGFMLLFLAVA